MAVECGWDFNFIVDNFTLEQVVKYYELINIQKLREVKINMICNTYAMAFANGNLKKKDFNNFLESLSPKSSHKEIDVNQELSKLKTLGNYVEEK